MGRGQGAFLRYDDEEERGVWDWSLDFVSQKSMGKGWVCMHGWVLGRMHYSSES